MLGRLLKNVHAGEAKLAFHAAQTSASAALRVTSTAFANEGRIPARYTPSAENISPPLAWDGAPADTRSALLIIEDPDAPLPFPFVYGIVYGLPAEGSLAEGAISDRNSAPEPAAADTFRVGRCTMGPAAYRGPRPVEDHGPHRYCFEFFALDCMLGFNVRPKRTEVLRAVEGHVLAKGILVGTYERTKAVRA